MERFQTYEFWKLAVGVLATIGLYTVLYRENKMYRFFEHVFLGLAAGWTIVALWTETLYENWWLKLTGRIPEGTDAGEPGFYLWALLLPIGLMGYLVFSRKHNWMSRIPIGIIIGLWAGQQFGAWINRYGPQIQASSQPILPTTWDPLFRPATTGMTPDQLAQVNSQVYFSQALINLISLVTVLCVLSYFLFSFNWKGGFMGGVTRLGRYLLMIGFGAIFGSTVMMRFSLLIDRMYFVWVEFVKNALLGIPG